MREKLGILTAVTLLSVGAAARIADAGTLTSATAVAFAVSKPVRDLAPAVSSSPMLVHPRINPLAGSPDHGARGTWNRSSVPLDPIAPLSRNPKSPTPSLDLEFDGLSNPDACGGCSPPDTNGDIGARDYVQIVNATKIGIFKRKTGTMVTEFDLGSLWTSGPCTADVGDPVALYDNIAKRWVFSQLASPHHVCFAVSATSDPTGAYYLYLFDVTEFPDYFKIGVWPNAYLASANQSSYSAMAFDRLKMLKGDPNAGLVRFTGETNFLMPADVNDASTPTGGGYFYTFKDDQFHGGADRIELFQLTPHFGNTAKSKFKKIATFDIASFTYTVCGFFNFDCIPQKDTAQKVDAVSEWPMQRLAYRQLGGQQEMVGNFTVGGGTGSAGAAIRWFELRNTGSGWSLAQEGTQDLGDGLDRWMGSIAMDAAGNIALGYSASSSNDYPSIRYATRTANDPLGTLGKEKVLKAGGGSQTGSDRWGDYSGMAIDAVGGCQFWYTTEYYSVSSSSDWQTAVGAFTMPNCP
jgi:hypothetical protein